jgi:hypothetical protein
MHVIILGYNLDIVLGNKLGSQYCPGNILGVRIKNEPCPPLNKIFDIFFITYL